MSEVEIRDDAMMSTDGSAAEGSGAARGRGEAGREPLLELVTALRAEVAALRAEVAALRAEVANLSTRGAGRPPGGAAAELLGLRGDVAAGLFGIRQVVGAAVEGLRAVHEETAARAWREAVTDLYRYEVHVEFAEGCCDCRVPPSAQDMQVNYMKDGGGYGSRPEMRSAWCVLTHTYSQLDHGLRFALRWETDNRLLLEVGARRQERSGVYSSSILRAHDLKDPANAALAAAYAWALEAAFGAAPRGARAVSAAEVGFAYAPKGGPRIRLLTLPAAALIKRWREADQEALAHSSNLVSFE